MHNPIRYTGQPALVTSTGGMYSPEDADEELLPERLCTQENLKIWRWLVNKGITNAMTGLSQMIGRDITVTSLDQKRLPVERLIEFPDKPEVPAIGVNLTIEGDASGHLILIYHPHIALRLVDLQLGLPEGSTLKMDEMEYSILGEMGNITGSFFLNALADNMSLVLMSSPPSILDGTVEGVMRVPLTMIVNENNMTLVIKAAFAIGEKDLAGTFLVLPGMDLVETILSPRKAYSLR